MEIDLCPQYLTWDDNYSYKLCCIEGANKEVRHKVSMGSRKGFIWTTVRISIDTAWIAREDFAKIC